MSPRKHTLTDVLTAVVLFLPKYRAGRPEKQLKSFPDQNIQKKTFNLILKTEALDI